MTRVAVITPYAAPIVGGISTFAEGLSGALRSEGHTVSLLAGQGRGDVAVHSNLGTGSAFVRRTRSLLRAISPDVIHCHSHTAMLASGVTYVDDHPEVRLVFSFHTTPVIRWPSRLRSLLARANVITFVSEAQRSELRRALQLDGDLRVLRPAITIRGFDAGQAKLWAEANGVADANPLLSFIGPLEYPRKVEGVLDLIRSLPAIRTEFPSTRLAIAGDGSLRDRVEAASAPLGRAVRILGFIKRSELILAVTDIYCHISYQEGLPVALLEAMSLGKCVIASPIGGVPEVIDESNGVLVDGGLSVIADAVCRLASSPQERARLGQAARETIEKSYTWKARRHEILSLYGLG